MFPLEKSVVQLPLLGGDSRHSLPCLAIRASSAQAGWDPVLALPPARVCCGVHSVQCMGSGGGGHYFTASFVLLGLARGRDPRAHPYGSHRDLMQDIQPLWFVRRELFGEGGGFSQWWKEAEEECLLTTPNET